MPLPGMVVVKEEVHRLDAENVAAFLRSKGLDAVVRSDDAGGEIPAMDGTRFVQVLVPDGEAEQARAHLDAAEQGDERDETADQD